ncbi:MarR family transcriptional regulator [Lacticaseibacillus rhamnosus MTCC 5462]|nr:MarR family transcriptional regulator [Lacticaseibacillus rhamnosus MTCC 5462]
MAPFKLTYPQYITLLSLYEHGTMSVKQVGQTLELDSGTLTPLMKTAGERRLDQWQTLN